LHRQLKAFYSSYCFTFTFSIIAKIFNGILSYFIILSSKAFMDFVYY